jgi:hypothetical protein
MLVESETRALPTGCTGSCGGASLQTVKRYIQAQRVPSRWVRSNSA